MNIVQTGWQHLHDHLVPNARNDYNPHVLKHRTLHLYAGFLVSLKILTLFSLGALPENQIHSSAITSANIIQLTNSSRAAFNAKPLKENTLLNSAAQAKAEDMLAYQYFAHNSPAGKTPWDFIGAQNYNYIIAGENLAINFSTAEDVEDAWMNSPGHKANILNKDFEDIGIGIVQGSFHGVNAVLVAQMFGSAIDQPIKPLNAFTVPAPEPPAEQKRESVSGIVQKSDKGSDGQRSTRHSDLNANKSAESPGNKIASAVSTPILDNKLFYLTNKAEITITGSVSNAASVNILVNDRLKTATLVNNDRFNIKIGLVEGENIISAVAINAQGQSSQKSGEVMATLDSKPPQLIDSVISAKQIEGKLYYHISTQVSGEPVKIIANLGENAVMLRPADIDNVWQAYLEASDYQIHGAVVLKSYDIVGNTSVYQAGNINSSVLASYGFTAKNDAVVSILGNKISGSTVNNFYLYFIAGVLAVMAMSIAIKSRIQNVTVLAHASAVVVLAVFLWFF